MSRLFTPDGFKFIVTEQGKHCIKVYNDRWKLLHSFGGEGSTEGLFNTPAATAITGLGTVLVADIQNHRISHYSLEGQFLSHIVTTDDGLGYPLAMSY